MKTRSKASILIVGAFSLALGLAWWLPNRAPAVAVWLISTPPKDPKNPQVLLLGLMFAVSNTTSRPMDISLGPRPQYPPDFPRGQEETFAPGQVRQFRAQIWNYRPPWTILVKTRRLPGKVETWLRSWGAKLRLCDPAPSWQLSQVLEVDSHGITTPIKGDPRSSLTPRRDTKGGCP